MPRSVSILISLVFLAAPAAAQDGSRFSVGYAYLKYLEEGGGSVPVGAFLSLAGRGTTTLELDAGYHRDSEPGFKLDTYTLTAGPRFAFGAPGGSAPFIHLLGGVRHDRIVGEGNTSFGGMAGAGVDIMTSGSVALRLGADFQMFFDEGDNLKTLRLGVGLTF